MFYLELGQRLEHLVAKILIPKCPPKAAALVDYDQAALPLVFIPAVPLFVKLNKQGLGHEPQGSLEHGWTQQKLWFSK